MNLCVSHVISISIANIFKKSEIHKLDTITNSHLVIGEQNLLIISHETSSKFHKIMNKTSIEPITAYVIVARYSITNNKYLRYDLTLYCLFSIVKSYNIA